MLQPKRKRILVTGATGRIGANLVQTLILEGYSVRSLVAPNDPYIYKLRALETEIITGNLECGTGLPESTKGIDTVVHLGAIMGSERPVGRQRFFDVNVRGTFALLDAATRAGVNRFVLMSSTAVYDTLTLRKFPASESASKKPLTLYGATKVLCERMASDFSFQNNLSIVILRTNFVQACDEVLNGWTAGYALNRLKAILRNPKSAFYSAKAHLDKELAYRLEQNRDHLLVPRGPAGDSWCEHRTDVRDVVQAVILAIKTTTGLGEAFNVCGPTSTPREHVIPYLAEKLGVTFTEEKLPVSFSYSFSNKKAESLLGYKPRYGWKEMIDSALVFRAGGDIGVIAPTQRDTV